MIKRMEKGFSLIELLLIVALLGILAAIVVNSVTNTRDKSRDAKAKQTMSEFVTFSAKYAAGGNNSFTGLCASTEANNLLNNAFQAVAKSRVPAESDCISDEDEYIAAVPLIYKTGYLFCTDQTGGKFEINKTLPLVFTSGSVSCLSQ